MVIVLAVAAAAMSVVVDQMGLVRCHLAHTMASHDARHVAGHGA